jgi:poly-gamma-glutamate synthesis protein (capsule biosynthesis protein)
MNKIRLMVVGDVSFAGRNEEACGRSPFLKVGELFDGKDLVIGNLECPLTGKEDGDPVPNKCKMRGDPAWAGELHRVGFHIMDLANNHLMDYGRFGLGSTISALTRAGVGFVGAGMNREEACKPLDLERKGKKLSILARTSVHVTSPSYATEKEPGVAWFEIEETTKAVAACRERSHYVIVLVHWGVENYFYPSRRQREEARKLIDNGADIIVGHHPHVIQGMERYKNGVIAYSLGNFLFDEFLWESQTDQGEIKLLTSKLTPENREGVGLAMDMDETGLRCSQIPTRINDHAEIEIDRTMRRERKLRRVSYPLGLGFSSYQCLWRLYSTKREFQLRVWNRCRTMDILSKIHKFRFRHIVELYTIIRKSSGIIFNKRDNPYD